MAWEVLKRLKADPRTNTIPVVILTSSKEERDLVNGYGLGANSYIQKPVDFEQFRETVKTAGLYWLYRRRLASLQATHSLIKETVPAAEDRGTCGKARLAPG
jgi:DNA-binding response OmpR family regulator